MHSDFNLSYPYDAPQTASPLWKHARTGIIGITLIGCLAAVYGNRLSVRAQAARADAITIATENRDLCVALGFSIQSESHRKCANGLDEVRRHHEDRLIAEAIGIL